MSCAQPRLCWLEAGRTSSAPIPWQARSNRASARRGASFRLRRAGKLVVVASGEPALVALDVSTGDVVWRFDRAFLSSRWACIWGEGCLGIEPFRRLINDPRFAGLPLLIETEKAKGSEKAK